MNSPSRLPAARVRVLLRQGGDHYWRVAAEIGSKGHDLTEFKAVEGRVGLREAWCRHCRYLLVGSRGPQGPVLAFAPALLQPCYGNPDRPEGCAPTTPAQMRALGITEADHRATGTL